MPADGALHSEDAGYTPMQVSGATTLLTSDLLRLLAEARPVVIEHGGAFMGPIDSGRGGAEVRSVWVAASTMRRRIACATGCARWPRAIATGRSSRSAVTWNASTVSTWRCASWRWATRGWTGTVAGREAWEVNGQPEADRVLQDW